MFFLAKIMNSLRKICSKCFLNGLCMCLHEAASLLLVIPHGNSQKSYLLHTFYCCVMLMINTHLRNQCCSVLFETAFGWYVWYMHGNTSWDAFVVCFVWADERKVIPCHSCGTRLPQVETHLPAGRFRLPKLWRTVWSTNGAQLLQIPCPSCPYLGFYTSSWRVIFWDAKMGSSIRHWRMR